MSANPHRPSHPPLNAKLSMRSDVAKAVLIGAATGFVLLLLVPLVVLASMSIEGPPWQSTVQTLQTIHHHHLLVQMIFTLIFVGAIPSLIVLVRRRRASAPPA